MMHYYTSVDAWNRLFINELNVYNAHKVIVRELPSMQLLLNDESTCNKLLCRRIRQVPALIRIETKNRAMWFCGDAFSQLGCKDSLVSTLLDLGLDYLMPPTTLLRWDINSPDEIVLPGTCTDSHLLKPALGCQGNGILFTSDVDEIFNVISNEARAARAEKNFVQNIEEQFGRVPAWSIQVHIESYLLRSRKFHVRAYVLVDHCRNFVYYYDAFELRLACKPYSCVTTSSNDRQIHITNGAGGNDTIRIMVDEIDDIEEQKVLNHKLCQFLENFLSPSMVRYLLGRRSFISSDILKDGIEIFSFAALDMMVDQSMRVWLLECNARCPGCPSADLGSVRFQQHLSQLAHDIIAISWHQEQVPRFRMINE